MRAVLTLLVALSACGWATSQCYQDSDISLYHTTYPPNHYQEDGTGRPQCIPNYAVMSETNIDDTPDKGITCSKKGSTGTNGYWTNDTSGAMVTCDNATAFTDIVRALCQTGSGSVTIYTPQPDGYTNPPTNFTCYIDGSSVATIRVLNYPDFQNYFRGNENVSQLESCIIIPPSDITAIPQQYLVQMNISVIPFSRLSSLIDCTNGSGITCEQSYYTLIDLDDERYQMTVPVTWSTNDNSNTNHSYTCRVRFGGLNQGGGGTILISKNMSIYIIAASAPSVSYEAVNATAINVLWSISGDVNGFLITSSDLNIKHQLTDGSLREYVINGLLPETNYTVEVRGYYELLGPAETTTVRLEAGINTVNGSALLSVSDDLSTQLIQVNCYTFRADQVTWMIDSVLITPDSSYQPVNGSVLLDSTDQTYRHYITLNGSFTVGTTISCNTNVNGETVTKGYTLQAPSSTPTGLSATILSPTSLSISWSPLSGDVNGYVIQYTGGQPVMVNGEDSLSRVLEGLTQGTTYQIYIYSYSDLLSSTSTSISVLLDVPVLTYFDVQPVNSTSVRLTWSPSDSSIIDNNTLSGTRLCDNMVLPELVEDGSVTSRVISMLSSGFQYGGRIIPVNILGEGMERTGSVTLEEAIPPSVAPVIQSLVTINSTAVRVTWEEVNCSYSNGNISGYRVVYYNIDGEVQQSTINITDNTTSTVITGLMEFRLYYISVAAVNSIGAGPYSQDRTVYTINSQITNILGNSSTTFVQLSWQPLPPVTNVSYEYEVAYGVITDSECTGNDDPLPNGYTVYSPRTNISTIEVLGLMSGTCYVFGVRALVITSQSNSTGEFSIINEATVSDDIEGLNVLSSVFRAQLSWSTLPDVSIDVYFYEVGFSPIPSDNCFSVIDSLPQDYISYINTTNGSVVVTGLLDDACYVFGVRAYSTRTGQYGRWSIQANTTLSQIVSAVSPDPDDRRSTSIVISWSPLITQLDDSFIYEIGYSSRTDETQCIDMDNSINTLPNGYTVYGNTTDNSITVTGLQPGTCYVFGVRIYSAHFNKPGQWSIQLQRTRARTSTSSLVPRPTNTPGTTGTTAGSNIGVIGGAAGGGIVAVLVIIIIVIIVVIVFIRYKSSSKSVYANDNEISDYKNGYSKGKLEPDYMEMNSHNELLPTDANLYASVDTKPSIPPSFEDTAIYANTDMDGNTTSNGLYENPGEGKMAAVPPPYDPMIPVTHPVPVDTLGRYVAENHSNANTGFKEQYKGLYTGEERSCEYGQREEFKVLNRFKNITVYDCNHIVLQPLPTNEQHNEFVNASYINGYSIAEKYIACQGPLPRTVGDFWHVAWQEKVQYIVILTNLMEEKKKKCARYWPEVLNACETYGQFNVTLEEEETLLHYVVRILRVELIGCKESRIVTHYQYITWPDYGVPDSVSPFMTLQRRVMNSWNIDKGPIIVHCSAGVGRTGTFIAVDMALEQAEKEGMVDIAGIVCRMREQRMKMVQTDAQYVFIHDAVLESVMSGGTEIRCDRLQHKLQEWRQPKPGTNKTPLETQFELLSLVTPDQRDISKQTAEKFPDKNRSLDNLPHEKFRVILKGQMPDYINATFIHGYREKRTFIMAQSPMENTVRDFLKMIVDHKPSAIVMCCELNENGKETCASYWDQNEPKLVDDMITEVVLVSKEVGFTRRVLKVSDNKMNSVTITQFQLTEWPSNGVCNSPKTVLDVMEYIGRVQRKSGKGPIIVHCSDSIGRSGIFCAAYNAIEQCKVEGVVDVFQATKAIRMHKPGAVTSLDQYSFLHEIVQRYLDQNSDYSNFQS